LHCILVDVVNDYMYHAASTLPGNVRLVGGSNRLEGRLEIQHMGIWGTVCDDNFDDADARVACFSLGFGFVQFFAVT
jgi:Scavenger receptor cysteine-rich domain